MVNDTADKGKDPQLVFETERLQSPICCLPYRAEIGKNFRGLELKDLLNVRKTKGQIDPFLLFL
jgi:hypothetical protein